jgi:orotidine-5'-phosphate decarboxylase
MAINNIKERISELSNLKKSRIILALDKVESLNILSSIIKYVAGVKIGLPLLISIGADNMKNIIINYKNDAIFIADLKASDIPETNENIAKTIKNIGFDAIIAHAFAGSESLKALAKHLSVFSLIGMTHKDSYLINSNVNILIKISQIAGITNFVAPATYPDIIKHLRKEIPNALIISPGVGAQGAPFGSALKVGANFEIIGRSITTALNPVEETQKILKLQEINT